ncbi:MAG: cytosolic protein, partial [Fimbriimonadales bacterium]
MAYRERRLRVPRSDAAWKLFLEQPNYLRYLIRRADPLLHNMIDWRRGVEYLENELQQITPESATGRQIVDKLVRVYLRNGEEQWILIHIEVQSQPDPSFAERVYAYNATIWLRYRRQVVSIAILADTRPAWRPTRYERVLGNHRLVFEFVSLKVIDLDEAELLADPEPAALILAAFKRAAQTKRKTQLRLQARIELLRLTVERGYNEELTANLLGLLEWIMNLPKLVEREYERALEAYKRETGVPIVPRIVEMTLREGLEQGIEQGLQKGLQQGLQQGLQKGLQQSLINLLVNLFGRVPRDIRKSVRQIQDPDLLLALQTAA